MTGDRPAAGGSVPARAPRAEAPKQLAERYASVRATTRELSAPLSAEDASGQSMPDASPAKWHLAHTSWFFETFVLEREIEGYSPFHHAFRVLFNSYYNSVGEQHPRPRRGLLTRPSLEEVLAYRARIDERILALLERGIGEGAVAIVELGLQHEQQHQELVLTDVKHLLSCNPLRPAYESRGEEPAAEASPLGWRDHAGATIEIGADGRTFAFDNELPRHPVILAPFSVASRPVTNGEYLEFMADGGYTRPELWLSEGWDAVHANGWRAPLYWEETPEGWQVFTLAGMRPVDEAEPVCHVSFYEADAYARWAGVRLPSEAEWESCATALPVKGNLLESSRHHPAAAAKGDGLLQIFGDVWEWTSSPYGPYPGYRPPPGALGEYNGKFMCSQLVLRGGSCATPASHVRASYRNFFPPSARWQFSGFRLARDAA